MTNNNNKFELQAPISLEELMRRAGLDKKPEQLEVEVPQPQNFKYCPILAREKGGDGRIDIVRKPIKWYGKKPEQYGNVVICEFFASTKREEGISFTSWYRLYQRCAAKDGNCPCNYANGEQESIRT